MQGAVVYQWRSTVPGREQAAMELMRDSNAFSDKMVSEGRIADYHWYLSGQGGMNFLIVRGEMEQLTTLSGEPELLELNTRAEFVNTDYSWGYYATGDAVSAMTGLFEEEIAKFG